MLRVSLVASLVDLGYWLELLVALVVVAVAWSGPSAGSWPGT
jgi:hypothetical protein